MDEAAVSLAKAHLRVARPTDHLTEVVQFYRDGLGFEVLYEFTDHDGFDGIMLGHKGAAYHLEFTRKRDHTAGRAPTEDNLLVFYLPDKVEWQQAVQRIESCGYKVVKAFNPYWDKRGRPSRIQTDIEWCCRTRAGLRERGVSRRKVCKIAFALQRCVIVAGSQIHRRITSSSLLWQRMDPFSTFRGAGEESTFLAFPSSSLRPALLSVGVFCCYL